MYVHLRQVSCVFVSMCLQPVDSRSKPRYTFRFALTVGFFVHCKLPRSGTKYIIVPLTTLSNPSLVALWFALIHVRVFFFCLPFFFFSFMASCLQVGTKKKKKNFMVHSNRFSSADFSSFNIFSTQFSLFSFWFSLISLVWLVGSVELD